jgi:hypothetical protein
MAILTYINKMPLYSTVNEALAWAEQNGLQGYHAHKYKDVAGYMGGYRHPKTNGRTTSLPTNGNQLQQTTPTQSTPSTGGGEGY